MIKIITNQHLFSFLISNRAFSVHSMACDHNGSPVQENSDHKTLGITTTRKNTLKETPVLKGTTICLTLLY